MTLYILGNGFDLKNNLKTKYSDFANWLKEYDYKKYCQIQENFKLNGSWSDFEDKIAKSLNDIKNKIGSYNFNKSKTHNLDDLVISSYTISKFIKEWISKTIKKERIITNKNIINFNYTDYIEGKNVFYIHENISSGMSLHFGHSQPKKIENRFLVEKITDFGKEHEDHKSYYNQLTKYPNIAKSSLKGYISSIDKIDKLVFYGFSFGMQDIQYFDIFNKEIEVDYYYFKKDHNLESRVYSKFKNVNFIDSKKWKEII